MKQFLNVAARAAFAWVLSAAIFVGLPFLLFGCDSRPAPQSLDTKSMKSAVKIGYIKYGDVYRIEDEEKGNLIYIVECTSTGTCGITVVSMNKK